MNDTLLIVLVDVVGVPVAPPAPVTAFVPENAVWLPLLSIPSYNLLQQHYIYNYEATKSDFVCNIAYASLCAL